MMLQTIKSLISVLQSVGLGGGAFYVWVVHMELEKKRQIREAKPIVRPPDMSL